MKTLLSIIVLSSLCFTQAPPPQPTISLPEIRTFEVGNANVPNFGSLNSGKLHVSLATINGGNSSSVVLPKTGYHMVAMQYYLNSVTGDSYSVMIGYGNHGWNCRFAPSSLDPSQEWDSTFVRVFAYYRLVTDDEYTPLRAETTVYSVL